MSLVACDVIPLPHQPSAGGILRVLRLACTTQRWQHLLCTASLLRTCKTARDAVMQGVSMRTMFFRHCVFFLWHRMAWPRPRCLEDALPALHLYDARHLVLYCPLPSRTLGIEIRLLLPLSATFAERLRETSRGCNLQFLGFQRLKCDTRSTQPRKRPSILLPAACEVYCRYDSSRSPKPMFRFSSSTEYTAYLCFHCLADVLLRVGDRMPFPTEREALTG